MEFQASSASPWDIPADWLILGVWENEPFHPAAEEFDLRLGALLSRLRERGDFTGKWRESLTLHSCPGLACQRLLLLGLGQRGKADVGSLTAAAAAAARTLTAKYVERLVLVLPQDVPNLDDEKTAVALAVGLRQGSEGPALRKAKPERHLPKDVILIGRGATPDALRQAEVESQAISLARELVNLPPNELYPESFADRARQVAQQTGLECLVLDETNLAAERMQSLLAVARGSERPPRFVILRHHGGGGGKTLGLIGKGVTFDSGGLSLKTTEQMVDMKCDMAGAAAVLAAMKACAELKTPVNILGLCALVENLPSGRAMKLGDVLRARNGKTIEVLNTDAEGRLILADALSYAVDQQAAHLVDLATLTGACMVALGPEVAGVMSNHEGWSGHVLAAAAAAGEKAWPLPMWPHYGEMIKSDIADMKNTGGSRYAGAISAAKFLEEFVGGVPWTHLDIAGPAWAERESTSRDAGGTGFGVRTLIELARRYPTLS